MVHFAGGGRIMISNKTALISEPKVLITGVEGAGKTLFAVQQADLLTKAEGGVLYTKNIRGADPGHLPQIPFDLSEMAFNADGTPRLDPETGDHIPRWATLEPGSVILVDEAHKVFPQRGPGRPPKWIEMLAEGRQFGIRFILLTQAPSAMDSFLRDRISRHYHLERKGNMERATVFEFDHCVMFPRTAWQERKDAQVHFWAYPKEYYGWYTSAKTHSFKLRIPWKIWAALAFVPVAIFIGWQVYSQVGGVMDGVTGTLDSGEGGTAYFQPGDERDTRSNSRGNGRDRMPVTADVDEYQKRFEPLVAGAPWSAPAFQSRAIEARPELYCASIGAGYTALGEWREPGCSCLTEQGTRYKIETDACMQVVADGGSYNPHRREDPAIRAVGEPAEPRFGASGVQPPAYSQHAQPVAASTGSGHWIVPSYGDMGVQAGRYQVQSIR